jgi:hypothetical protein
VGFLDDLKRQAEAVKAEQTVDVAALERNTLLAESACKTVFTYFDTLLRQLEVLKPVSKVRYVLDRRTSFDQLPLTGMKVDARRKKLRGNDVYDHIALHARLRNGQKLALVKDFLPDIEQIESRIRQSGAPVHSQAVRNPDNGKLQEMRYELAVDFHPRHAAVLEALHLRRHQLHRELKAAEAHARRRAARRPRPAVGQAHRPRGAGRIPDARVPQQPYVYQTKAE